MEKSITLKSQSANIPIQVPRSPILNTTAKIYPATKRQAYIEIVDIIIGNFTSPAALKVDGKSKAIGQRKIPTMEW